LLKANYVFIESRETGGRGNIRRHGGVMFLDVPSPTETRRLGAILGGAPVVETVRMYMSAILRLRLEWVPCCCFGWRSGPTVGTDVILREEVFVMGAARLGNPLNAMAWLVGELARRKRPLRAGDVVLSAAFGP
jgi:hypothetical protein